MNVPTLWRSISRTCYQAITKIPQQNNDLSLLRRDMHCICSNKPLAVSPKVTSGVAQCSELLRVTVPTITPNCGMKVKGMPKLRCKDCYFVVRQERLYVMCKTKQRHKQMAMKAKDKKFWMLSHATQGFNREW